jgi:hypothetical protein
MDKIQKPISSQYYRGVLLGRTLEDDERPQGRHADTQHPTTAQTRNRMAAHSLC